MPENVLVHTISAELRYQLTQIALDLREDLGSWHRVVLTEQYETICRFLDHPHAVPEPTFKRVYLNKAESATQYSGYRGEAASHSGIGWL